jgi:hypothetical protein
MIGHQAADSLGKSKLDPATIDATGIFSQMSNAATYGTGLAGRENRV